MSASLTSKESGTNINPTLEMSGLMEDVVGEEEGGMVVVEVVVVVVEVVERKEEEVGREGEGEMGRVSDEVRVE